MDTKRSGVFVVVSIIVLLSLALIGLGSSAVVRTNHVSRTSPTSIPQRCSERKVFQVPFTHSVTVCLEENSIRLKLEEDIVGGSVVWFSVDEWSGLMRLRHLIEIAITDFVESTDKKPE